MRRVRVIGLNTDNGVCRTIKAQYNNTSVANFLHTGDWGAQVQWRFMKHRKMVMADPIKRFGEIRPSEVVSPALLATDYKSPHLVLEIYD